MALGGLDIGTSGCKCTIMSADGKLLASSYQEYTALRTADRQEIDAEELWCAVKTVMQNAVRESGEEMTALTVTSFGECCVVMDKEGKVLAPIMLYTDPRGQEEVRQLSGQLGEKQIYQISGHRPNAMYFLPKLMWIRTHMPAVYERIARILPIHSFIIYRLSGEAVTDYSLASRLMMFDVRTLEWSDTLLKAGGISADILPAVAETGTVVGTVRGEIASQLGLCKDLQIVVGCQDQIAAAIGAGVMKPGMAVNGSGTVECITSVFQEIPEHPALFDGGFAMIPVLGCYVTYITIFSGGALLQWYRNEFGEKAKALAEQTGKSIYSILDEQAGTKPSGLLVLPHFAGAANPYMNPEAKGAICGLTLSTSAADVYRGILEGITYETRVNIECLERAGIRIGKLRTTGGGARSHLWTQIKADILKRPFATVSADEAGAAGSIMLAGTAVGTYASLSEAMEMTKERIQFTPAADCERYEENYARYKKVYEAMQEIYR